MSGFGWGWVVSAMLRWSPRLSLAARLRRERDELGGVLGAGSPADWHGEGGLVLLRGRPPAWGLADRERGSAAKPENACGRAR